MKTVDKIGLALSGGGAMGVAHIGVLEVLDRNGIRLEAVSGSSAGAIAGLLYCDGGLEEINNFFNDLKSSGLLNRTNLIIKRNIKIFETIELLLRKNVKAKDFDQLATKFYCVATNIADGTTVVLDTGDPIKAVMASAAYPGIFPIQKIDDNFYIDGGITRNLPAILLKDRGMNFIIGSSLYSISEIKNLNSSSEFKMNSFKIAMRALDITSKTIARTDEKACDFCFYPPVENYYWFDLNRAEEIRHAGRNYAQEKIDNLLLQLKLPAKKRNFWQFIFGE